MRSALLLMVAMSSVLRCTMAAKMSDMERRALNTQMENNKDKIAALNTKIEGYINELMTGLKDEHAKGDVLKKFIAAHPNIDTKVSQSIDVVLMKSKMVGLKVSDLLNKLDLSKKLLNNAMDANLKCLQMIVNYSDDNSNADEIKQICSESQTGIINAANNFSSEEQLLNSIREAQDSITNSAAVLSNVQSVIDKFVKSNMSSELNAPLDPIDSYPISSKVENIQTQLPPIQTLSTPNTSALPIDTTGNGVKDKTHSTADVNNPKGFSIDNISTNQATALPFDPVSPIPPSTDTTGTASLPLDGLSTVMTGNGTPIPTNSAATSMTNDLNPNGKVNNMNNLASAINSNSELNPQNVLREYSEEEYAMLLERIRNSMDLQNNLIVRNRLYLSRFDEILTFISKTKERLKGAISNIPRVSVDYDQTILQFDKLTENSDDIERALIDRKNNFIDDITLLTQVSQESKTCVENLVVKSSIVYNKCMNLFNYWNNNVQRLQQNHDDAALFARAEIINKSMGDMVLTLKSSGVFMNKDASDSEVRDVPVAQSADDEFIVELNGIKPLTQIEDVIQMANDANDLIKSILKEIMYTENSFNNNYQLAQESQTEMEILSKNEVFSNPIHKNFFDECKQILKNSQNMSNNNAIVTKFFITNKEEINEISNDLTVCISSLTNLNEHSDEKKAVMEKCRQAASRTNKLNDVLKGDEFQNLITHMENLAKNLSQHAISMRTIAKADAPLTEPAVNEISNDSKIVMDEPANFSPNLRSSETGYIDLNLKPSSSQLEYSISLVAIHFILALTII